VSAPFAVKVVPEGERVILAPVGELDMGTVDQVWEQLEQLREAGFDRIVLDLRGLTFMDSSGLHLMVRANQAAAEDGFNFALIDGNDPVKRVLDLTGLREHLPFIQP
jgi:anti-sigma B factor antagonist